MRSAWILLAALPVSLLAVGLAVLVNFDTVMGTLLSYYEEARQGLRLW